MTGKAYPNPRDCEHGRRRGSCEICDYEQVISELKVERDELLAIIDECRPKVLSAQMRADDYAERTGDDRDYAVFLSQLLERIDAALANR